MHYFQQSLNWFKAQSNQKKSGLVAGLLFIFAITITLGYWVVSPNYGVLFNHLDSQDASQIISQLEQSNIAYQLRNQGSDILIDKQLIDKTRIKLMGNNLQLTHSIGFELFDKSDFGMTDFSQKINYQRALQGELERTINSLDEIKQARVHLVIPEGHLFQQENNLPRAAVTLHLKQSLSAQQIKSIQLLITASVANLSASNVIIVDQNGNSLTANEEESSLAHFNAKKSFERYMSEKISQMLNPIFTDEGVIVRVDATLNYDELQRELVKPQHDGLITHEKETQHTVSNKLEKTPGNQDITREKSYQFGQEKEHFTRANGTIERLTISVVLPQKTDKERIAQVERLVKSVVGFDAKRGDTISVEALIVEPQNTQTPEPTHLQTSLSKPTLYGSALGLLLLSGFALLVHRHKQIKQRQHLLIELNQWLVEHD